MTFQIDSGFLLFFLGVSTAVSSAMAWLIRYILNKVKCIEIQNGKINIIYSLFKTHLKNDGKSNIDLSEFDKYFEK